MSESAIKPAAKEHKRLIPIGIFAVYAVLTLIGALNHEIWFDEAQAWNIARDNDISGIIAAMRYEGHPPLWHFILKIFTSAGCPADVLPIISWVICGLAAALFLWKAPFKLPIKTVVLFSGGFLFYNSVTSRVYCVIMLLLVLIAITYKSRNEHPIVFGLLVALLANTHIMMCGLVGIIGIYMIIDLFSLWKSSSAKSNILRLVGLAIAGIGVIALILPLIGSIQANTTVSAGIGNLSLAAVFSKFFYAFPDTFILALLDNDHLISVPVTIAISVCGGILYIAALFLLRHYRKAFIMQLVYTLFYQIIGNVLWRSVPTRAVLYIFSFAVIYWIAVENENPVYREPKPIDEKNGKLVKKLIGKIRQADRDFDKSFCTLLIIITAATIPNGAYRLFRDYFCDYDYSKSTAEFIRENLPEDSVFVTNGTDHFIPQYAAYLPEYKFYSLGGNIFSSYAPHNKPIYGEITIDYDRVYSDLKDFEHIYILDSVIIDDESDNPEVLFSMGRENSIIEFDLEEYVAQANTITE